MHWCLKGLPFFGALATIDAVTLMEDDDGHDDADEDNAEDESPSF